MRKIILFFFMAMAFGACQESMEERAAREALRFTRDNCPSPISENIIIDSMTFESATRTLHYYYQLAGADSSEVQVKSEEARKMLLHDLKNATTLKDYKDAGFNFAYTFRSQADPSETIFDFLFTPQDY